MSFKQIVCYIITVLHDVTFSDVWVRIMVCFLQNKRNLLLLITDGVVQRQLVAALLHSTGLLSAESSSKLGKKGP